MDNNVYINAPMLDSDDLNEIFNSEYIQNTEFELFLEHGLLPPGTISCVFLLAQNIGYDVAYDLIKYVVLNIWKAVTCKNSINKDDETIIKIDFAEKNGSKRVTKNKTVTITTSYKMNPDERQNVIDTALKNLLGEKAK